MKTIVSRSVRVVYPGCVKCLLYPELSRKEKNKDNNLKTFDLNTIEMWMHPDQASRDVSAFRIFLHLKKTHAFSDCLGLANLLAIEEAGVKLYRRFFSGRRGFGWKSVALCHNGCLAVPYVFEHKGTVKEGWLSLNGFLTPNDAVLRFK